jgi:hypothetical protein
MKKYNYNDYVIIDRSQLKTYPNDISIRYCEDCACDISSPSTSTYQITPGSDEDKFSMTPDMDIERLTKDYVAVFNPTSEKGIVVLNNRTLKFLNNFKTAKSLSEVKKNTN